MEDQSVRLYSDVEIRGDRIFLALQNHIKKQVKTMVNYGTIYTLPFKSRKEVSYLIEIQKENYEGKSTELVGSGNSPFP